MLDTPSGLSPLAPRGRGAGGERTTTAKPQAAASAFDPHAFPEGDVPLDVRGLRLRVRVIPGGVLVHLPAGLDIVVAGRPLPAADRVRGAVAQVLAEYRLGREVVVALDHDRAVTLRQDRAVPGCPRHAHPLATRRKR